MSSATPLPGSPRLAYAALPAGLRHAVDAALGSPVSDVSPRQGGFSPGPAAVLTCADGRRAFVKAVGTPLNAGAVDMFRTEGRVTAALPGRLPVPRLLGQVDWSTDGADWVALLFDVQDGAPPALPWTADRARTALAAVDRFTRQATPCPVPGLPSVQEQITRTMGDWAGLADAPDLHPWERDRLDWLAGAGERLAARGGLDGDTLVHLDLRADNLLVAPDGRAVLLDWPWASRGAAWVDGVLFALDPAVHGGIDPEQLVAGSPVVRAADPVDVTDLIAGLLGMWGERMRQPPPPGLPTLRVFQRRFHDACLDWLVRRTAG